MVLCSKAGIHVKSRIFIVKISILNETKIEYKLSMFFFKRENLLKSKYLFNMNRVMQDCDKHSKER